MSNLPRICKKLREMQACRDAVRYVGRGAKGERWQDRWDKCRHPDWMFWLLVRHFQQAPIKERRLVLKCFCECVKPTVKSIPEAKLAIADVLRWATRKLNTAVIGKIREIFLREQPSIEARAGEIDYAKLRYRYICNTVSGALRIVPFFACKTEGRHFADTVSGVVQNALNARRYAQLRDKVKAEKSDKPSQKLWFGYSTRFYNAESRRMADVVRKYFPKVPKLL